MKKINVSVPEPCHEDWNKMTKADQGKFCGSCQKTVIDFSAMTDQQLVAYFKKPAGSVCGRFHQDQLNRDITVPTKRIPWLRYFFQILLPAFLLSLKAQGQTKRTVGKVAIASNAVCKDTQSIKPAIITPEPIFGQIKEESGTPVPYASILIKGTTQGVVADSDGRFSLAYKKDLPFVIVVSSVGFEAMEYVVKDTAAKELVLPSLSHMLAGEVVVTMGYAINNRKTIPLISSLKRDTLSQQLKVYPNPARSGGTITIESKKLEKGNNLLQITSMEGKAVCTKAIEIERKGDLLRADLPVLVPGHYMLSVTNSKSKKVYTEKIQVQ